VSQEYHHMLTGLIWLLHFLVEIQEHERSASNKFRHANFFTNKCDNQLVESKENQKWSVEHLRIDVKIKLDERFHWLAMWFQVGGERLSVLVNTFTFTWMYTRTHEKGRRLLKQKSVCLFFKVKINLFYVIQMLTTDGMGSAKDCQTKRTISLSQIGYALQLTKMSVFKNICNMQDKND
jgi:hypothetical protein